MVSPTVRDTVHATDRVAGELEEWQLTFGQGPCVDAFTDGRAGAGAGPALPGVAWPAGRRSPRPRWTAGRGRCSRCRCRSARSGWACSTCTGPGPAPMSPHELADALAFADTAGHAAARRAAGAQPDTAELAWQRDDPTAHQAQVHQATGMILVQLGVSAEAAFARLRAYAYAHDRRLGDVARDVVERRLRFEPDPDRRAD